MAALRSALPWVFFAFSLPGCLASSGPGPLAQPAPAVPPWVHRTEFSPTVLCGLGIAGAGYPDSPYPPALARERAIENLAGAVVTRISEAIVDHTRFNVTQIELSQLLQVDSGLQDQISTLATTRYWQDSHGQGPFAAPGFTYASACIPTPPSLSKTPALLSPDAAPQTSPPRWLSLTGRQPDGRHCALGRSLPTFFSDRSFQNVIKDIRLQLSEVITTLVSSYHEERESRTGTHYEEMTVASTEAVSRGALITDYWFDVHGEGPAKTAGATYGWGCIYPVHVLKDALTTLTTAPQEKPGAPGNQEKPSVGSPPEIPPNPRTPPAKLKVESPPKL